jgi:hypothetical protein
VEIPDGHYTIDTLEQVIVEVLYKQTRNGTTTITQTSTLWDDMNILVALKPSPADLEFTLAGTAAQLGNVLAVTELPPQHLLGSEITHTGIPAGTKIGKITGLDANPVSGEKGRIFLSQSIPGASKIAAGQKVTVAPIGTAAADFKGFGAGQLAYPSLNHDSGWGTSLDFEELLGELAPRRGPELPLRLEEALLLQKALGGGVGGERLAEGLARCRLRLLLVAARKLR